MPLVRRLVVSVAVLSLAAAACASPVEEPVASSEAPLSSVCVSGTPTSGESRFFPQTGHAVAGIFLDYMRQTGSGGDIVAGTGYPISGVFDMISSDGRSHPTQCFERRVLEYHPQQPTCAYQVQGKLLGAERLDTLYPMPTAPGQSPSYVEGRLGSSNPRGDGIESKWSSYASPIDGHVFTPRFFSETSQTGGALFMEYWDRTGGLAQNGFPISGAFKELSEAEPGKELWVQYFERAVFEWHPENAGTKYEVQGKLLGNFNAICRPDRKDVVLAPARRPRNPGGGNGKSQAECQGCYWITHTSHTHAECNNHEHEICFNWSGSACFENASGRYRCI